MMRLRPARTLAVGLTLWSLSPVAAKTLRFPIGAGTPLKDAIDGRSAT
jgi:hypothetical protein